MDEAEGRAAGALFCCVWLLFPVLASAYRHFVLARGDAGGDYVTLPVVTPVVFTLLCQW
jgi:hypothetical protein